MLVYPLRARHFIRLRGNDVLVLDSTRNAALTVLNALAMLMGYTRHIVPSVARVPPSDGPPTNHGSEENHHPRCPATQSKEHTPRNPAEYADRDHRIIGLRQVFSCV